jgi:hypothetical protein
MGILGRLFLLVAIALVPVTAIQIYDEMDRHHSREAELNAEALRLATLVDMEQNRVLEGARQLLIAVAQLRSLREHDRTRCKDLFGRFATRFPYYVYIAALDLKGNAFCATRTDLDRGALTPERPFFAGALTSHDFAVGGFSRTKDGKGVLQLGFPIINERDGRVTGVLVAALNLEWLSANLGMNILPPHAVLNVADRYGTIIAHLPQSSALNVIGEPLPETRRALLYSPSAGTVESYDATGHSRIFGYDPIIVPPQGLYIEVGLDRDGAFAEIARGTVRHTMAVAAALHAVMARRTLLHPAADRRAGTCRPAMAPRRLDGARRRWREQFGFRAPRSRFRPDGRGAERTRGRADPGKGIRRSGQPLEVQLPREYEP